MRLKRPNTELARYGRKAKLSTFISKIEGAGHRSPRTRLGHQLRSPSRLAPSRFAPSGWRQVGARPCGGGKSCDRLQLFLIT